MDMSHTHEKYFKFLEMDLIGVDWEPENLT